MTWGPALRLLECVAVLWLSKMDFGLKQVTATNEYASVRLSRKSVREHYARRIVERGD